MTLNQKKFQIDYPYCDLHQGEPLINICLEKEYRANCLCCNECLSELHLNHKTRTIKGFIAGLRQELDKKTVNDSQLFKQLEIERKENFRIIDDMLKSINDKADYFKAEVNTFYDRQWSLIADNSISSDYVDELFQKLEQNPNRNTKEGLQKSLQNLLNLDKHKLNNRENLTIRLAQTKQELQNQIQELYIKMDKTLFTRIQIMKEYTKNIHQNFISKELKAYSEKVQIVRNYQLKEILALSVSQDKKVFATSGTNYDIQIWDARNQSLMMTLKGIHMQICINLIISILIHALPILKNQSSVIV